MKKALLIFISFVSFLLLPLFVLAISWEDGRLNVDYSIDVYYENVYGNLDRSSLDVDPVTRDNWHYNETLKLRLDQKIIENMNLEFLFYGRHTTDKQIGDYRAKILQIYLRIYGENYEVAVGDISEYYTKYTFNNTFLGTKALYRPTPMFEFMALGGRNREGFTDTFEHTFGGGRILFTPHPNYKFGTTYIHTEITKLFPDTTTGDYSNDVWSFDTRLKFLKRKLLFKGETALSLYNDDRRDPNADKIQGWAINLELDYKPIRELKFSTDYEYVEPNFMTIMGTAARDRETIKWEVKYTPSKVWKFWGKYKYRRNLLTNSSPSEYRTYVHYSEAGFTYRPFYENKDSYFNKLKLDLRADYTNRQSNDLPRSVDKETFSSRLILSNSYEKMNYSLEYRFRYNDDLRHDSTDTMTNTLGVKWGYKFDVMGLDWNLNLGYKVDFKESYETNPDQILSDTITSINTKLGLSYQPTKTSLKFSYLGVLSNREDRDDTRKHSIKIAMDQVIFENDTIKSTLGVSYKNLDYWSADPDDRYGENIYMLNFTLHF